jgi:hypothetical protein
MTQMHALWRKARRPFRYPSCRACTWEVYDVDQAGCLKCGAHHTCKANAVDNTCPLIQCDDRTRVCHITGFILPEVRHAASEFTDTMIFVDKKVPEIEFDHDVFCVVAFLLLGDRAARCRELENAKQHARLAQHMHKQMRLFKLSHPNQLPNVCWLLAGVMQQERYWRFIEEASEDLARHCARNITLCLLKLRSKGAKFTSGARIQELVCGMMYMLKNGLIFRDHLLLSAIPEVDRCLPHENKIECYFGISSKVICMTENEVKLTFRENFQT